MPSNGALLPLFTIRCIIERSSGPIEPDKMVDKCHVTVQLRAKKSGFFSQDINISSFGEDAAGEIYVVGYRDGVIYRLVALL